MVRHLSFLAIFSGCDAPVPEIDGGRIDGMRLGDGQPPVFDAALAGCVAEGEYLVGDQGFVWTWDDTGHRLLQEWLDFDGSVEETYTSEFDGDLLVRVTGEERSPDPDYISDEARTYDADGHLATWTLDYRDMDGDVGVTMVVDDVYTWDGDRIGYVTSPDTITEYTWDEGGLDATRVSTRRDDPTLVEYTRNETWDEAGRLVRVTVPGTYLVETTWSYDADGRVIESTTDNDEDGEVEFTTRWTWDCP